MKSKPEGPRVVVPVRIRQSVMERARDAVFASEGLTLADLLETAITREVGRMERKRGSAFEPRTGDLAKTGRPSTRSAKVARPRRKVAVKNAA